MVFIVDTNKKPVNPCLPGQARFLLNRGKAAVYRQYPFTLILKEETEEEVRPLRIKIDPGSKTTGMAVVDDTKGKVVFALELHHRSDTISQSLTKRRSIRRSRRARNTRYRPARFANRERDGFLPPSVESRITQIETWVKRVARYCHTTKISIEHARFDTQLMQNPEISDIQYQQGELYGYEVREYLLEKFRRTCSYCTGTKIPLEIDHIVPKSRGGSNRVSNLTLACRPCNQQKGNLTAAEFGYSDVQAHAKIPLKDAVAMNVMRSILVKRLPTYTMPLETGTGALTKFNRTQQNLEKSHWIDAACVGASTPKKLLIKGIKPLIVKATGHGSRQMCRVDCYGFPRTSSKGAKKQYGYQTGDMVQAVIPQGIKKGTFKGKVAVRANGFFNITTPKGVVQGIKHSYCKLVQKSDGYIYNFTPIVNKELINTLKPAGKDNLSSPGLKSHGVPGYVKK